MTIIFSQPHMENNNYQIGDIMDNRYLADINNNPYDQIINTITKRRLVVRVPFGRNPARGQLSRMYNSFHNIKDKKMYSGMKDLFY